MGNTPPVCKTCGLQHWHFQNHSEGKLFKQMGYDMIRQPTSYSRSNYGTRFKRATDYQRVQGRQKRRLYYQGDEYDGPEAA
jgi:hypothetical protein